MMELQKPVKLSIKVSSNLKKAAKDHVTDLGESGIMTQIGTNGLGPKERMEKYTGIDSLWSETLLFGGYKPKEIVEYMLVSDGDPARGLRKNIFNPKLRIMGIAIGPHPEAGSVTVVDFVSKELAEGESYSMKVEETDQTPEELQKKVDDSGHKAKVINRKGVKTNVSTRTEETTGNGTSRTKTNSVSLY
jgi:hypothetical protein